jgi:uncharacterized protein (DUF1330 family)
MSKAYWVSAYRSVKDPAALSKYAELATKAITAAGGRFVARGVAAQVRENGIKDRTVIIEFDSLEAAVATYEGNDYRKALDALGDAADRDFRIVEGV